MSRRRSRKNTEEAAETVVGEPAGVEETDAAEGLGPSDGYAFEAVGQDEDSREEAVEELDDALEALSEGDAESSEEVEPENPLTHVDVSGETSFGSVEF